MLGAPISFSPPYMCDQTINSKNLIEFEEFTATPQQIQIQTYNYIQIDR